MLQGGFGGSPIFDIFVGRSSWFFMVLTLVTSYKCKCYRFPTIVFCKKCCNLFFYRHLMRIWEMCHKNTPPSTIQCLSSAANRMISGLPCRKQSWNRLSSRLCVSSSQAWTRSHLYHLSHERLCQGKFLQHTPKNNSSAHEIHGIHEKKEHIIFTTKVQSTWSA